MRRRKADGPQHAGVDPGTVEVVIKLAAANARVVVGDLHGLRLGQLESREVPVEAIVNQGGVDGQRPVQVVVKQAERATVVGVAGLKAREPARHRLVEVKGGPVVVVVLEVALKVLSSMRLWESDAIGGQRSQISQPRVGPVEVQPPRRPRLRRTARRPRRQGLIRYTLLLSCIVPGFALAAI